MAEEAYDSSSDNGRSSSLSFSPHASNSTSSFSRSPSPQRPLPTNLDHLLSNALAQVRQVYPLRVDGSSPAPCNCRSCPFLDPYNSDDQHQSPLRYRQYPSRDRPSVTLNIPQGRQPSVSRSRSNRSASTTADSAHSYEAPLIYIEDPVVIGSPSSYADRVTFRRLRRRSSTASSPGRDAALYSARSHLSALRAAEVILLILIVVCVIVFILLIKFKLQAPATILKQ